MKVATKWKSEILLLQTIWQIAYTIILLHQPQPSSSWYYKHEICTDNVNGRHIFGSFWLYVIRICPVATDNPCDTIFLELVIYIFHNYTNGSMMISKQATGCVRSNFVMTSGCRTPITPITWPLATTSAQRCGKYAGSARKQIRLIKHAINAGYRALYNTLSGMWYELKLGHGCYYFDSISFEQVQ